MASTGKTVQILVVGSLNTDLVTRTRSVPAAGETRLASSFATGAGGKGLNQAVACARASHNRATGSRSFATSVSMIGAVGDDLYGQMLRKELKDNLIHDDLLQTYPGSSGVAVIVVEEDTGDNRILVTPGANYKVELHDLHRLVKEPDTRPGVIVLQLEVPVKVVLEAMKIAKEHGIRIVLNPAPPSLLPLETFEGLDHLILNLGEAEVLAGLEDQQAVEDALPLIFQKFFELRVKNTIVTLGGDGVAYSTEGAAFARIPAVKDVQVVDTTAAGDTFVGSYAAGLAQSLALDEPFDIKRAIEGANGAAARTVSREGAIKSIPWQDEL